MKKYSKLSIIIPVYNEGRSLSELVAYVQQVPFPIDYEIVVVDDASLDPLGKEAEIKLINKNKSIVKFFRNQKNSGKGFSIRRGLQEATGDLVMVQDADSEYSPLDIPKLLKPLLDHEVQVVYGSRFLGRMWPKRMRCLSWAANRFLTGLTNVLFNLKLTDMETCYKVFDSQLVKGLPLTALGFEFEPEVTALLAKRKIIIKELPISYSARGQQEGKKIRAKDFFKALLVLWRLRW